MFFLVLPLFLFPLPIPLVSANVMNHSNLSAHVLHTFIFSLSCHSGNAIPSVLVLKPSHFSLCPSNSTAISSCNSNPQKHLFSLAFSYSKSKSHNHNLILKRHNSLISSTLY